MPPTSSSATVPSPASPAPGAVPWRRLIQVYLGLDAESADLRLRLVRWVTALAPAFLGMNVVVAALLAALLAAPVAPSLRWAWCVLLCGLCLCGLATGRRHDWRAEPRAGRAVVAHAVAWSGALGALWAVLPWALFPQATPGAQMVVAVLMPALIALGSFVLMPLAPAALAFCLVVGLSSSAAFARLPGPAAMGLAALMAGCTMAVALATAVGARRAVAAMRADREAARQKQLVALLLRDFESQSADVLWETDAQGRFSRVSPKLMALLELAEGDAGHHTLLGWFESRCGGEQASRGVARLRQSFDAGQAFRLRGLAVVVGGKPRWWAVTARPLVDEAGGGQGWRGVISDITQEHEAQSRMQQLALVDSLTGLANRTQLRDRLQARLQSASARPAALLCLDMDHFKRVNDLVGHATGDLVLREAALRLRKLARGADLVARAGGDEFAVLINDVADEEDARHFGQRVVEELRRGFASPAGLIGSGASVGVVMLPGHGRTVDELLANADLALGMAKSGGRARCEMFHPDMGERLRLRMTLERDLRQAVARDELRLHWQPQVDTLRWRVSGCEALLRWHHPELGLVPPMNFIPLAEETGLIVELGEWVLGEACRVGAQKLPGLMVAVNVSPIQVVREDFVHVVRKALGASGLPPERLEIEITESLFIDASPKALNNLEALRRMGIRVALDDFGTGYSSLAYLRQFPFDTLKIDRAFVRELVTQHDARAIVRSIVELAAALGMSTVAEGVEEPAQYELLRRAGCASVQGFLIARPMPVDDVVEMLESWAMQHPPQSAESVPDSIFAPLGELDLDDEAPGRDGDFHH